LRNETQHHRLNPWKHGKNKAQPHAFILLLVGLDVSFWGVDLFLRMWANCRVSCLNPTYDGVGHGMGVRGFGQKMFVGLM
jgi:hypothetical protein